MRAATKQRVECVRAALLALPDERLLSIVRPWVDDVLREIQESDEFAHMLGYKIQASLTGRIYDVDDDDDATDDELALVAPDAGSCVWLSPRYRLGSSTTTFCRTSMRRSITQNHRATGGAPRIIAVTMTAMRSWRILRIIWRRGRSPTNPV